MDGVKGSPDGAVAAGKPMTTGEANEAAAQGPPVLCVDTRQRQIIKQLFLEASECGEIEGGKKIHELDCLSLLDRYGLPPLSRMPIADQAELVEPLLALKRLRILGLDARAFEFPEVRYKRIYNRARSGAVERAQGKRRADFAGDTASALNAFMREHPASEIHVLGTRIEADETVLVPSGIALYGHGVRLERGAEGVEKAILLDDVSDVVVSSFDIRHFPCAVFVKRSKGFEISDNRISRIAFKAIVLMGANHDFAIARNHVSHTGNGALYFQGDMSQGVVEDNIVEYVGGSGNFSAPMLFTALPIEDMDTAFNPWKQLDLTSLTEAPHDIVVIRNRIRRAAANGLYSHAAYCLYVVENVIEDNNKEGMCLDFGSCGCYVAYNLFKRNGGRFNMTEKELEEDFVQEHGMLPDGSSPAKVPGISLDNGAYNILYHNIVAENYGSGIKMVRSGLRNVILCNEVTDNNLDRNDRFHFYGIELGSDFKPDYVAEGVHELDFAPCYENIIARNTVSGNHYSGIYMGKDAYINDAFDNVIIGSPQPFEVISEKHNAIVNNLTFVKTKKSAEGDFNLDFFELRRIDYLRNITFFLEYLIALKHINSKLIVFAVKDTPGFSLNNAILKAISDLGLKERLEGKHWCGYAAAIFNNKVLFEELGDESKSVKITKEIIKDISLEVLSSPFKAENCAKIVVNGFDYAVSQRGINIVVYDHVHSCVIDSVAFDTHVRECTCFRKKNLSDYQLNETLYSSQNTSLNFEGLLSQYFLQNEVFKELVRMQINHIQNMISDIQDIKGVVKHTDFQLYRQYNGNKIVELRQQKLLKTDLRPNITDLFLSSVHTLNKVKVIELKYKVRKGERIKCCFLIDDITRIGSSLNIYKAMTNIDIFDPFFFVYMYHENHLENNESNYWQDYVDSITTLTNCGYNVVTSFDVRTKKYTDLECYHPDIVFISAPYLNDSISCLGNTFLNLNYLICFIDYGMLTVNLYNYHHNSKIIEMCWKHFVDTWESFIENRRYSAYGGANNILLGYPKLDDYVLPLKKVLALDKFKEGKLVVVALHWTIDNVTNFRLGTFNTYIDYFLQLVIERKNINFIFRPHPNLRISLNQKGIMSYKQYNDYLNSMNNFSNSIVYTLPDYIEIFKQADLLITDCGSFIGEWLPSKKPCIYLVRNDMNFKEWIDQFSNLGRKILDTYYLCRSEQEISSYLDELLLKGNDPKSAEREKLSEELFVNIGTAGQKIAKYLEGIFKEETV